METENPSRIAVTETESAANGEDAYVTTVGESNAVLAKKKQSLKIELPPPSDLHWKSTHGGILSRHRLSSLKIVEFASRGPRFALPLDF
ncbi:hypothetical protein ACOSQ2_026225 [Xanthoceras sorbifolium]